MKYIFTALCILSSLVFSFAQSLTFVKISPDSLSGDVFTEMEAKATVENTEANTNTYKVERFELDMTPGHSSYFCWSIDCYPTNVSLATSSVTLAQGEQDSTFIGYLTPYDNNGGIPGTSVVKYVFFNENNAADTISTVFVYTATSASSLLTKRLGDNEFHAYPNPTVNKLNIAFGDIKGFSNGRVIVRNVLGSELINQRINLNGNIASIDVSRLERGVYFYTIQLDGDNVQTKKFAVSK